MLRQGGEVGGVPRRFPFQGGRLYREDRMIIAPSGRGSGVSPEIPLSRGGVGQRHCRRSSLMMHYALDIVLSKGWKN